MRAPRTGRPVRSAAGLSAGFLAFLGVCSAWAAAATLLPLTPYGAALDTKSIHAVAVARSLLAGEGFLSFDGSQHTLRPPLFVLVLAAAGRVAGDPLHLAGPLNAAFFALSVFLVGRFLAERLDSRFLRFCSPAAAALSLPLAHYSSFAGDEALFVLLTTAALLRTEDYLAGGGRGALAGAAVFGALAWQTRFVGAAVPAAVVLALLFGPGAAGGARPRIRAAALSALTAAAPMGLWLSRNFLVAGVPTGHYRMSGVYHPAGQILGDIAVGLAQWTWIGAGMLPGFALLSCAFAIPVSAFLFRAALSRSPAGTPAPPAHAPGKTSGPPPRPAPPTRHGLGARGADRRRTAAVFGGFTVVYPALLTLALATGHTRPGFEPRFLVPVYLPLLVSGAVLLDRLYRPERKRRARRRWPFPRRFAGSPVPTGPTLVSMAALGLWTLAQVPPGARAVAGRDSPAPGPAYLWPDNANYASDGWTNSPTVRFLRTDPLRAATGPIWSNLPGLVYLHETRGRKPVLRLPPYEPGRPGPAPSAEAIGPPGSDARRRPLPRDAARHWLRSAPEGAPVVWFHDPIRNRLFDFGPPALRVTPGVEPVAEFEDGAVFRVNPAYAAATNRYRTALDRVRSGAAGPPEARSAFDLYLEERAILYLREPCSPEDEAVRGLFFVETAPPEAAPSAAPPDPPDASSAGAGFVFPFLEYGVYLAPRASSGGGSVGRENSGAAVCVLIVPLETGAGRPVRAGALARDHGEIWAVEIPPRETAAR